ncbi:MAG TPA: NYN domain-containing protein [Leptolyngbyaceae cyanobacterium]
MKVQHSLFSQVALAQDLPEHGLKRGDIATIVEHYPMPKGEEDGYSLEGFDVPHVTLEVAASQIIPIAQWQQEEIILRKLRQLSKSRRLQLEDYLDFLLQKEQSENVSYQSTNSSNQKITNREIVAIFIDGSNLFYSALKLGIEIDYIKLLESLTNEKSVLGTFFYTGIDPTNEKQKQFLLWMRRNDYRVISKDLCELPDGSKKANINVEIAIDMLSLVNSYDRAILVSGDGDLSYVVDKISSQGVRVDVISLREMTSDSLINVADRYIDLEDIKENIKKPNQGSLEARPTQQSNNP